MSNEKPDRTNGNRFIPRRERTGSPALSLTSRPLGSFLSCRRGQHAIVISLPRAEVGTPNGRICAWQRTPLVSPTSISSGVFLPRPQPPCAAGEGGLWLARAVCPPFSSPRPQPPCAAGEGGLWLERVTIGLRTIATYQNTRVSELPPPLWGRVGVGGSGRPCAARCPPHPSPPPRWGEGVHFSRSDRLGASSTAKPLVSEVLCWPIVSNPIVRRSSPCGLPPFSSPRPQPPCAAGEGGLWLERSNSTAEHPTVVVDASPCTTFGYSYVARLK